MNATIRNPTIIIIFGLPGTGKTTFARFLGHQQNVRHFNTDIIRTMLGQRGKYDEKSKELIYSELLSKTEQRLINKESVIVDGTFYKAALREQFKELAVNYNYEIKWIQVCAEEQTVKKRISKKREYSEADYSVHEMIRANFDIMEEDFIKVHSDQEDLMDMSTRVIDYINS